MDRRDLPFGGKTIVFSGDFMQVLPVVRKWSRAQIVIASLRMSYLWNSMRHLKLMHNIRAKNGPWYAKYLLRIGELIVMVKSGFIYAYHRLGKAVIWIR